MKRPVRSGVESDGCGGGWEACRVHKSRLSRAGPRCRRSKLKAKNVKLPSGIKYCQLTDHLTVRTLLTDQRYALLNLDQRSCRRVEGPLHRRYLGPRRASMQHMQQCTKGTRAVRPGSGSGTHNLHTHAHRRPSHAKRPLREDGGTYVHDTWWTMRRYCTWIAKESQVGDVGQATGWHQGAAAASHRLPSGEGSPRAQRLLRPPCASERGSTHGLPRATALCPCCRTA